MSPLNVSFLPTGLSARGLAAISRLVIVIDTGSVYIFEDLDDLGFEGVFICNDPGARGVQNLAKEAIALNKPRAGVVIEKSGRS